MRNRTTLLRAEQAITAPSRALQGILRPAGRLKLNTISVTDNRRILLGQCARTDPMGLRAFGVRLAADPASCVKGPSAGRAWRRSR